MADLRRRVIPAIVLAAIAGDVAITAFLIIVPAVMSRSPVSHNLLLLMQWDASNAYGDAAFAGGWTMAAIGQIFDIVVSLGWAALFAALWLRFASLHQRTWAWGLVYGIVVMVVMLYGFVPLGHATRMHDTIANVVRVFVAHTVFFGLPLALVTKAMLRSSASERKAGSTVFLPESPTG
jgi:hypothetical protein